MNKKTIRDVDVEGKRVLVRCDFNVPIDENSGKITDNTRITEALPTIQYLMNKGAKVILCSHLGRPEGKVDKKYSLKPVADELDLLLDTKVKFAEDVVGESAKSVSSSLNNGEVALLENVRFDPREEQNDDTLAIEFADLTDGIYVNDAFGTAHRAHASTEGVSHHVDEAVAGFLMENEIDNSNGILENPDRPLVVVLGGGKIKDKIGIIDHLIDIVDVILIGGGMAYTFLKAEGKNIGDSIYDEQYIDKAKEMLEKAKKKGVKLILPKDTRVAKEATNESPDKLVEIDKIPEGYKGLDIGPKTFMEFADYIRTAKTIFWNGPLGVCEKEKFAIGTEQVAQAIAQNHDAEKVVGGGDSIAAIKKLGLEEGFTHISTGGGALLELLEGKDLPGLVCLNDKEEKNQCKCKKICKGEKPENAKIRE